MKNCTKCNQLKELTEFYKSSRMKDGLQSSCKVCNDAFTKASRAAKPDKYRERRKELRGEYREVFVEWKKQQKCLLCVEDEVSCLDLHHLDPSEKEIAVSTASSVWTWTKLQTEIKKCVVLCRNCHAKVHAGLITLLP